MVEHHNFARAAKACDVTQQALSASISRLEQTLDIRLFDRGRTGGETTPEADAFVPFIELAFTELERGKQALYEAADGNIGEVRFGIGQTFAGHIVPEAVAQMNAERPGVVITMAEGYAPILAQAVIDGKFDFFVGAPTETMVSNSDLCATPLFEIDDKVICRAKHPLARRRRLQLAELRDYPWLFAPGPSDEKQAIVRAFSAEGLEPPPQIVYSDTIATAQALLSHADYLIVGQPEVLAPLFEHNILTSLPVDIALPHRVGYIGMRRGGPVRPCVRRLVEIIEQKAEQFSRRH